MVPNRMAPFIVRVFVRLIVLLVILSVARRSIDGLSLPSRPGSRGQFMSWAGIVVTIVVIILLFRSCGVRL